MFQTKQNFSLLVNISRPVYFFLIGSLSKIIITYMVAYCHLKNIINSN
jgi:hypothetical protein